MLRYEVKGLGWVLAWMLSCLFMASLLWACSLPSWDVDPDTIKKDISLEEARSLAPFDLCFPSTLPPGVKSAPLLTYHDEREGPSGPLIWAAIYAEYVDGEGTRVLELRQEYAPPGSVVSRFGPRDLVGWLVKWYSGFEPNRTKAAQPSVVWTSSTYQAGDLTYDAVEASLPGEWRGSLVTWFRGDVRNTLYSSFLLSTTLDVARSTPNCGVGGSK